LFCADLQLGAVSIKVAETAILIPMAMAPQITVDVSGTLRYSPDFGRKFVG
jgi:hypothetical protein